MEEEKQQEETEEEEQEEQEAEDKEEEDRAKKEEAEGFKAYLESLEAVKDPSARITIKENVDTQAEDGVRADDAASTCAPLPFSSSFSFFFLCLSSFLPALPF